MSPYLWETSLQGFEITRGILTTINLTTKARQLQIVTSPIAIQQFKEIAKIFSHPACQFPIKATTAVSVILVSAIILIATAVLIHLLQMPSERKRLRNEIEEYLGISLPYRW